MTTGIRWLAAILLIPCTGCTLLVGGAKQLPLQNLLPIAGSFSIPSELTTGDRSRSDETDRAIVRLASAISDSSLRVNPALNRMSNSESVAKSSASSAAAERQRARDWQFAQLQRKLANQQQSNRPVYTQPARPRVNLLEIDMNCMRPIEPIAKQNLSAQAPKATQTDWLAPLNNRLLRHPLSQLTLVVLILGGAAWPARRALALKSKLGMRTIEQRTSSQENADHQASLTIEAANLAEVSDSPSNLHHPVWHDHQLVLMQADWRSSLVENSDWQLLPYAFEQKSNIADSTSQRSECVLSEPPLDGADSCDKSIDLCDKVALNNPVTPSNQLPLPTVTVDEAQCRQLIPRPAQHTSISVVNRWPLSDNYLSDNPISDHSNILESAPLSKPYNSPEPASDKIEYTISSHCINFANTTSLTLSIPKNCCVSPEADIVQVHKNRSRNSDGKELNQRQMIVYQRHSLAVCQDKNFHASQVEVDSGREQIQRMLPNSTKFLSVGGNAEPANRSIARRPAFPIRTILRTLSCSGRQLADSRQASGFIILLTQGGQGEAIGEVMVVHSFQMNSATELTARVSPLH